MADEQRQLTPNEAEVAQFWQQRQKDIQMQDKPVLQEKQQNFNNSEPMSPLPPEPMQGLEGTAPGQLAPMLQNIGTNETIDQVNKAITAQNSKDTQSMEDVAPPAAPEQAQINPATGTPYDQVFNMQEASIQNALKAGQNSAIAQEAFHTERAKLLQADLEKQQQAQAMFDEEWKKKTDDYEQTVQEMKDLSKDKVYPGAFLARQDTIGAVSTGIAVALGAFAATAAGTNQNLGIEMINKAIDRDIDSQKYNLDKAQLIKGKELDARNNLLVKMREKYSTDKAANEATRAVMLQMAEDKMKTQLAKTSLPLQSQAAAQQAMAQIKAARLQALAQVKASEMQSQAMKGLDPANLSDEQLTMIESNNKGFRERYVPGWGAASSKFNKEEFDKYRAEVEPAINSLKRIQALTNGFNRVTDLKKRAEIQTEMNGLVGSLRLPLTGPGILTESERTMLLNEVIGNPNTLMAIPSMQAQKLKTIMSKLEGDIRTRANQSGLKNAVTPLQKAQNKIKY